MFGRQQCGAEGRRQAGTQQVHAGYKGGQQVYKILLCFRVIPQKAVSDVNDWDLSAARASSVVKYMTTTVVLDSEKFTVEGKAYIRLLPTTQRLRAERQTDCRDYDSEKHTADTTSQAVIDDILKYEYRLNGANTDPYERNDSNSSDVNSDVVNEIIDNMESKYDSNSGDGNNSTNAAGPKYEPSYGIPLQIYRHRHRPKRQNKRKQKGGANFWLIPLRKNK